METAVDIGNKAFTSEVDRQALGKSGSLRDTQDAGNLSNSQWQVQSLSFFCRIIFKQLDRVILRPRWSVGVCA